MNSTKIEQKITLADFEKRYELIRKVFPKVKNCSVKGCKNPRDMTSLGEENCCSYHRLLFEFWVCDVIHGHTENFVSRRGVRFAFAKWRTKIGKESCDDIVLELSQETINWEI